MSNEKKSIKCVVLGDTAVGKTALIKSYITNSEAENPSMNNDIYTVDDLVDRVPVLLKLWDTPGKASFDGLRSLTYVT